ncbi:hypothetical protein Tco_0892674 [Tanacetum coccineum]|uniref:Uncharacterized protein n=1 Tax=Tanacetum coccineum TaxID=301880 RepID=A0ABQ5C9J4_9ASTR
MNVGLRGDDMKENVLIMRISRIMPPKAMSEARMHEVIREQVATSMAEFMENMNRRAGGDEVGGAGAVGVLEPVVLESVGRAIDLLEGKIAFHGIVAANGYPMELSIDEAVRMAYQLMGQIIQDKNDEVSESEKRKGEGDRGGPGDNRRDYNRR